MRAAFAAFLATLMLSMTASAASVRVGSKQFTESVILGELACQLVQHAEVACEHQRELGGTTILWQALLRGDIDVYPEYSGTITQEIFARKGTVSKEELAKLLDEAGVRMSAPLGFNNTYALAMRKARARELGIEKLSDLERHPELAIRFSNEFMDRKDGWPALRQAYGLKQADVRGLDHDLAYRGIEAGHIDVLDVYSTDAEIAYYDLAVLADDRAHFPRYEAVFLARKQISSETWGALTALEGRIDDAAMQRMNAAAKLEGLPEAAVAARFAGEKLGITVEVKEETRASRIFRHTREHLSLVAASLAAALVFALPLGIVAARRRRLGQGILATVGVIQTIPSLALLVFMIPLLGIGGPPAIVALFLYSLLPIVRNTHQGLTSIAPSLLESAEALGLPPRARLWRIELPLASRAILAGVKTSAVINVGTATLGALIGAGGYGQPILTGIRLDDLGLIMEGALPAAGLALLVEGIFNVSERIFVPRGLRLER